MSNHNRYSFDPGQQPSAGSPRRRAPSGNSAVPVLVFVIGAIVIVAGVIMFEKYQKRHQTGTPVSNLNGTMNGTGDTSPDENSTSGNNGRIQEVSNADDDYIKRGFTPNNPVTSDGDPADKIPKWKFIGRSDHNRYHKPTCKYAQRILKREKLKDKQVFFNTAGDTVKKGYIPCRICKPPLPPATSYADAGSNTKPRGGKPRSRPISLPIKDVKLSFPFAVIEHEVVKDVGVITIEITAEVNKPLQKDNILLLARKLVAAETKKQRVNAVSIFIRLKVRSGRSVKWFCQVDWAPWGNPVRASEVRPGDYRNHQFNIYQQGFFEL